MVKIFCRWSGITISTTAAVVDACLKLFNEKGFKFDGEIQAAIWSNYTNRGNNLRKLDLIARRYRLC
jgi:hypothetical protein